MARNAMIDHLSFPDCEGLNKGLWHPVYFQANFDTPERLVAGVVACVDGTWHVETASSLEKLRCLYGSDASVAIDIVKAGMRQLAKHLGHSNEISDSWLEVSGLSFGEGYVGQAKTAKELSLRWLRIISSLHDIKKENYIEGGNETQVHDQIGKVERRIAKDRLPVLVMEKMTDRAPNSKRFFNEYVLRLERNENARLIAHQAYLAFDGRKVAANFSTLRPGQHKSSVDVAKRLMWDLEQHRENSNNLYEKQYHNIYLYHPSKFEPTITERQYENVMEVVQSLTDEGRKRLASALVV